MATERWIGGTGIGLTWTAAAVSADINSLANGSANQSSVIIHNEGANLDIFADVSVSLGSVSVGTGTPFVGIYLYPLNQDGTTYGDSRFAAATVATPPSQYLVGVIQAPSAVTGVVTGMIRGILIPPGSFRFVIYNQLLVALAASANVIDIRTYDRQVA